MNFKEYIEEVSVRNYRGIKDYPNGFGIILDILVGWVDGVFVFGATVPYHRIENALNAIKFALRAPKSPSGNLQGR